MNNKNYFVLVESDSLSVNIPRILGIYDHDSGVNKIQELAQIYSDKKYKLNGPFRLNTAEDSNYLLPKPYPPMPKPHPIVPPLQPDIGRIPNPNIFPTKDLDDLF